MAEVALAVGTGISAYGKHKKGQEQKDQAYSRARQLQRNASVTRAISQREAEDERRLGELAESKALAMAAASGGGVSNATIANLRAGLEAEGEYRALQRLWAGEEEASGMELEAYNTKKAGRAAARAGTLGAATTILSGAYEIWG